MLSVMNRSMTQGLDFMLDRWHGYPPMSRPVSLTLAVILSIIVLLGTVGNVLIIILFAKYKSLRTTTNTFMINLTVADLFMCVLCFPILVANCVRGHMVSEYVFLFCNADAFIGAVSGFVSILSLTALAADRCIVINRNMPMTVPTDKCVAYLVIVFIWLICGVFATMPLLGFGRYVMEGSRLSCTFDYFTRSKLNMAYNILIQLTFFVIPVIIISTCYICICIKVRIHERKYFRKRNSKNFDEVALRRIRRSRKFERNELKTARAAIILIIVFCLSWLPYSVVSWVGLFGDSSGITPPVVTIPAIFAKSSTVMNPVLYAFLHKSFQRKLILLYSQIFKNDQRTRTSIEQGHLHDFSKFCSTVTRKGANESNRNGVSSYHRSKRNSTPLNVKTTQEQDSQKASSSSA